jgi:hypothetical protein
MSEDNTLNEKQQDAKTKQLMRKIQHMNTEMTGSIDLIDENMPLK